MNEAFWFSTFNEWFCIELGKRVPHAAGKDTSRWTNVPALLVRRRFAPPHILFFYILFAQTMQ
jgi:hypothetical protein